MCRSRAICYACRRRCRTLCCCRRVGPQHHPVKQRRREISTDLCGVPRKRVHLQREAANTRTELLQEKLGHAMVVDSSGSKREQLQFCLGPSTGLGTLQLGKRWRLSCRFLSALLLAAEHCKTPSDHLRGLGQTSLWPSCCLVVLLQTPRPSAGGRRGSPHPFCLAQG